MIEITNFEGTRIEKVLTEIDKGIYIEKVWENAAPTSAFASQKIQFDASNCLGAIIVSAYSTSTQEGAVNMVFKSRRAQMNYAGSYIMPRTATLDDEGVEFGVGYLTTPYGTVKTDNMRNIPIEIYLIIGGN